MSLVIVLMAAALIMIALFSLLVRRLSMPAREHGALDAGWLENFSVSRYRPMERLLSDADYDFLASQPGYDDSIARRLRVQRRQVFRAYLASLERDFGRLHHIAKLMVLYGSEDRPDLARVLVRQKLNFYASIATVHTRLWLHSMGIGRVDVAGLLKSVESLQMQLARPMAVGAAA